MNNLRDRFIYLSIRLVSAFSLVWSPVLAGNCAPLGSNEACSVDTAQGKVVVYKTTILKVTSCSVWLELPGGGCDLVANRVDCNMACTNDAKEAYRVKGKTGGLVMVNHAPPTDETLVQ